MEAYELMVAANSLLLLIVTGLLGVIWAGLSKDKENNREDFKELYKTTSVQNNMIHEVVKLAELNSAAIRRHEEQIKRLERVK